ncbi:MAG: tyrosine--tRNA ligase [Candidatus Omnitrophica bacterium]|nr:tyrosine--tRNA ligase [Candidatus Omnitrophota bacterium]
MAMSDQLNIIKRGAEEIISEGELKVKLERSAKTGNPLKIKAGFDPSAPDIHLGHTVLLRKLRQFQDLGHTVYFLIGDFTGRIGDPSGQSETRKSMTEKEIKENAKTYEKQVYKILDKKKTKVVFNSKWFGKMQYSEMLEISSHYTVARILERDDFTNRMKAGKPISMMEFMYPLMQGYDSVVLESDVELGGTDQKFNLMVGRDLQREYKQEPQVVIMTPLLVGTDGVQKMSKSLNNYIGINEPAEDIFAKVMSVSDELMWNYYELLTDISLDEIGKMRSGSIHPRDAKKRLAKTLTAQYHNENAAKAAEEKFELKHGKARRDLGVDDIKDSVAETKKISKDKWADGKIWICSLITLAGCASSNNEARRLIEQGGVKLDGKKVTDIKAQIPITTKEYLLQVGKRQYVRIVVE